MRGKLEVFLRTKARADILRKLKVGMKPGKEKYRINQELFRQGIWNRKYGIGGVSI